MSAHFRAVLTLADGSQATCHVEATNEETGTAIQRMFWQQSNAIQGVAWAVGAIAVNSAEGQLSPDAPGA
jgi:hypothetical protein